MKKGKFIIGTGEKAAKLLLAFIFLGFIFLDLSVSQCIPPAIVTQPISQSVMEGQSVTFAVVASGTDPLSYQWQKDGVDIPGATSSSLTTGPVALSDNGAKYRVIVTNSCGSATSVEAILAVKAKCTPPDNCRLNPSASRSHGRSVCNLLPWWPQVPILCLLPSGRRMALISQAQLRAA